QISLMAEYLHLIIHDKGVRPDGFYRHLIGVPHNSIVDHRVDLRLNFWQQVIESACDAVLRSMQIDLIELSSSRHNVVRCQHEGGCPGLIRADKDTAISFNHEELRDGLH